MTALFLGCTVPLVSVDAKLRNNAIVSRKVTKIRRNPISFFGSEVTANHLAQYKLVAHKAFA